MGVLVEQGRSQVWLSRKIKRTHEHTNRVLNGVHPATPGFRAACARELGVPEGDLFHVDSSSASPSEETPDTEPRLAALARGS